MLVRYPIATKILKHALSAREFHHSCLKGREKLANQYAIDDIKKAIEYLQKETK